MPPDPTTLDCLTDPTMLALLGYAALIVAAILWAFPRAARPRRDQRGFDRWL